MAAAAARLVMRGAAVELETVIRTVAVPVPMAFVAAIDTNVLAAMLGTPEMMPVAESSVSPAGSDVAENEVGRLLAAIT